MSVASQPVLDPQVDAKSGLAVKRDERRAAAVGCGAHALHDGYTDLIYVLLPIWQQHINEVGIAVVQRVGAAAVGCGARRV